MTARLGVRCVGGSQPTPSATSQSRTGTEKRSSGKPKRADEEGAGTKAREGAGCRSPSDTAVARAHRAHRRGG